MTKTGNLLAADLENYGRIAKRMFPASEGLAICDRSGDLQVSSDAGFASLLAQVEQAFPAWPMKIEDLELIPLGDRRHVLVMSLRADDERMIGFLLWCVGDVMGDDAHADLYDALASLGACIRTELELHRELDGMALELADRYEELNLVYHTEDQVNYFREGYEAFKTLTTNCAEYLSAGLAILYMRDKHVFIESHTRLDATDTSALRSLLDDSLYDQVVDGNEIRFLNNGDHPDESPSVPYRIMAGPLISFGEHANGVLLIANPLSDRPFSNSDKNLLSVMSRKAAKIVQSSYDGLTGLINRASFQNLVDTELAGLRKHGGNHCLMHLNIDQLHRINETAGHQAGDTVICAFAAHVVDALRDSDWVARLGGDEIGILIHGCDTSKGERIAMDLLSGLEKLGLEWQGMPFRMTASIGLDTLTKNTEGGEQALKNVVLACDLAKEQGGNRVQTAGAADSNVRHREASMWMVNTVHDALHKDLFLLYAQPIEPLKPTGKPHLEILLRMQGADKILAPNTFLPASERYRLMTAIDRWVFQHALEEIRRYLDAEPLVAPVFGINLSGQSFGNPEFLDFLEDELLNSGVPGELVCFEITESAAIADVCAAQNLISVMKKHECKFALDDFGAGLSSFAYLKSFDVDYLKIDGALVKDVAEDRVSAAMVKSIHQIATVMDIETIAEYVENPQIEDTLARMGIDYVQGYIHGKPSPLGQQLRHLNSQENASQLDMDPVLLS